VYSLLKHSLELLHCVPFQSHWEYSGTSWFNSGKKGMKITKVSYGRGTRDITGMHL
jgi:hypothetical protein